MTVATYAGKHSFSGLVTCGKVWRCPVCARKVAGRRAEEAQGAVAAWSAMGGVVLLATFTHSHGREDTLADLVARQGKAMQHFSRSRRMKDALAAASCVGRITAFETTYGHTTGWHPHRHALLFVKTGADVEALERDLRETWAAACAREGLTSARACFDLRGGGAASSYVSKFGLEIALNALKDGRRDDRLGVWNLLDLSETHGWAGARFVEHAEVMKGKTFLKWSRGLRKRLGLDVELTDEQIADGEADEGGKPVLVVRGDVFGRKITAAKDGGDGRGHLLALMDAGKRAAVEEWLARLHADGWLWVAADKGG